MHTDVKTLLLVAHTPPSLAVFSEHMSWLLSVSKLALSLRQTNKSKQQPWPSRVTHAS